MDLRLKLALPRCTAPHAPRGSRGAFVRMTNSERYVHGGAFVTSLSPQSSHQHFKCE